METFFQKNTEVQEWVDLLIEKLFTVCLLSGSEADSEFFRGRQAAEKISSILQGIADLPEDTVKEGIRQLIEQRLPDPRVIDNFPQFYSFMEEMIKSGIPNDHPTESVSNQSQSKLLPELPSSTFVLTRRPKTAENLPRVYLPEVAVPADEDNVSINVFAPFIPLVPFTLHNPSEAETHLLKPESFEETFPKPPEPSLTSLAFEESLEPEKPSSPPETSLKTGLTISSKQSLLETDHSLKNKVVRTNQIPIEGDRLSKVLQQHYPEEQPRWNVMIGQYSIFAQVCNLIIYIPNETLSETTKTEAKKYLQKQGYQVALCQHEDLAYPRRLERFIRQALREPTYSNTSSSFLK
ncbi:hypothetical protein [Desulfitobacterium sp.]|uniref:hypothetical protein n=1 Tax=Desulfitobacterium sp. TaxID=49981 RepID=UPI002CCC9B6D|nr:hypothetical protein [Desulfitobacterium sp.]HVJ48600.1 hypothetical protein [Desulfitobacterium sp.]